MTDMTKSPMLVHVDYVGTNKDSFQASLSRVPCVGEYITLTGDDALLVITVYHCVLNRKLKVAAYIRVREA